MAEGFEGPQQDRELSGGARGAISQARETAASTGRDLLDRAVDKKDELKQRASSAVDDQRVTAVGRVDAISRALHGAASSLRDSGETQLSGWVEQAAGQVERVVGYMQGKPADGMLHDFEDLARRNPALFLGGTYLAGMAVGRFLRASTPEPASTDGMGTLDDGRAAFREPEGVSGTPWTGVGLAPTAADERTRPDATHGTGYGASGMPDSDSLETGELTSYTNGDERDSDPRRGV